MNIDLINQTLEVTENQGLDTFDPRFSDITTLVQNGNYLGAATQAEEVLAENIFDIRIIGYFLYGIFLEQGVGALTIIFQCLSRLLEENWEAIGPAKKREKHAQTSLNWFMKMLLKKLQYEEQKKSSDWNTWAEKISDDKIRETLDACDTLRKALGRTLEDAAGPILDGLMKVKDWLSAFERVVYRKPEPKQDPVPETEPEPVRESASQPAPDDEPSKTTLNDHAVQMNQKSIPKDNPEASYVEGSYHLKILLKKLEAFERLIEKKNFPGAAVVGDDINNIITHFDPKIYFPLLFSRFSLLLALNIKELASFQDYKKTLEWQTLEELYKVDLNAFVEFTFKGFQPNSPGRDDTPENTLNSDNDHNDEYDDGWDGG